MAKKARRTPGIPLCHKAFFILDTTQRSPTLTSHTRCLYTQSREDTYCHLACRGFLPRLHLDRYKVTIGIHHLNKSPHWCHAWNSSLFLFLHTMPNCFNWIQVRVSRRESQNSLSPHTREIDLSHSLAPHTRTIEFV